MGAHYFVTGLFTLAGTVSVLAAVFNWDWFFTAANAQFVVQRFGRKRARWVYGLIGLGMLAVALLLQPQEEGAAAEEQQVKSEIVEDR